MSPHSHSNQMYEVLVISLSSPSAIIYFPTSTSRNTYNVAIALPKDYTVAIHFKLTFFDNQHQNIHPTNRLRLDVH
ncbi:MAG: hypothetical protein QMC13_09810 [Colwellia sp.]